MSAPAHPPRAGNASTQTTEMPDGASSPTGVLRQPRDAHVANRDRSWITPPGAARVLAPALGGREAARVGWALAVKDPGFVEQETRGVVLVGLGSVHLGRLKLHA
jgi:hypothetical protein